MGEGGSGAGGRWQGERVQGTEDGKEDGEAL